LLRSSGGIEVSALNGLVFIIPFLSERAGQTTMTVLAVVFYDARSTVTQLPLPRNPPPLYLDGVAFRNKGW
jgi:hypothetical protein